MLSLVRDLSLPYDVRLNAAKACAQFCHAALKSVEVTGKDGKAIEYEVTLRFN